MIVLACPSAASTRRREVIRLAIMKMVPNVPTVPRVLKILPLPLLCAALLLGCSSSSNVAPDAGGDGSGDAVADTLLTPDVPLPVLALRVGAARSRMPCPLGIGTAGFAGFTTPGKKSPFTSMYPATQRLHGHPEFRAVAISRGPGHEVVFLRADLVGVFQQFRQAILVELKKRTGRSFDHALIFGATHTHSGPGRIIGVGGIFNLIADTFFPEFYERMVKTAADTVEAALADLQPGSIGWAHARDDEAINDRRCEDGQDHKNGALPILALRRAGKIFALVFSYPIHGTLLGIEEFNLSRDVAGAIEEAVEDSFDHPVQALFFNGWGADVSPGSPPPTGEGPGAELPANYERMERIGAQLARTVTAALPSVSWQDAPTIALRTHRTRIDREVIGYDDKTFPYPYGGVYCGQAEKTDCDPTTTITGLDSKCVPFNKAYSAPKQTVLTVGQLAGVYLVTFPGESGTLLGEAVVKDVKAIIGGGEVAFFGYSQDYLGYSVLEDDWWQGGYEAGGALWGPRQGSYLKSQIARFVQADHDGVSAGAEPPPTPPFVLEGYEAYVPTPPVDFGKVLGAVQASYTATEVLEFTVAGADAWLGTPIAQIEDETGALVTRKGGGPLTSDGYAFYIDLDMTPEYREQPKAPTRRFAWRFSLPLSHRVPGTLPTVRGSYRLRVELPRPDGKTETVRSALFEVVDP